MNAGRLGLIAGYGHFPLELARNLARAGYEVHCIAAKEETFPEIEDYVASTTWLHVGQLGAMIRAFQRHGIREVVMAGKVRKVHLFRNFRPDLVAMRRLLKLKDRRDDTILLEIASLLEEQGIRLIEQTRYAGEMLARPGLVAGPACEALLDDMRFGFRQAKAIAGLDIGQTVVVRDKAVMAVEAIEGTDEAIRRGGALAQKEGAVVVKVAKPQQDLRFDVPAVGPDTLRVMRQAGCTALCIEAEKTLLIERELFSDLAGSLGISVFAMSEKEARLSS